MAALASIAALALARHAPRDAQTRPPPNPRATNHPGVRRRDALLAVGTLSLCVATDREPSRAAEPERPTRPAACIAGTSCVSTASFRSPANYLPPWEYVGDDLEFFFLNDGSGAVLFRWAGRVNVASPPGCFKPGCINGPRQRARAEALQRELGWLPLETDEEKKWVPLLLH